jgi:hypothetical protein
MKKGPVHRQTHQRRKSPPQLGAFDPLCTFQLLFGPRARHASGSAGVPAGEFSAFIPLPLIPPPFRSLYAVKWGFVGSAPSASSTPPPKPGSDSENHHFPQKYCVHKQLPRSVLQKPSDRVRLNPCAKFFQDPTRFEPCRADLSPPAFAKAKAPINYQLPHIHIIASRYVDFILATKLRFRYFRPNDLHR